MKKVVFSSMLIFSLSSFSASAALIEGLIQFSGVDWSKDGTALIINDPIIGLTTGDFVGQTTMTVNDLDYSPFAPGTWWTTDDFSFAITTLTLVFENPANLIISGTGTLSASLAGLDPTFGRWSYSSGDLNWSAITSGELVGDPVVPPSAVPVPAAVWLFGTALIGLVGFGKRKSRIAA
jgi:hypothetical protein